MFAGTQPRVGAAPYCSGTVAMLEQFVPLPSGGYNERMSAFTQGLTL